MIFSATTAMYIGNIPISKAYIGDTQVWSKETIEEQSLDEEQTEDNF